ncbi:hypothetical protein BOO92_18295 [Vibrio navarrensis]|nr:hypothetical protein [Vibrio navarrensis]
MTTSSTVIISLVEVETDDLTAGLDSEVKIVCVELAVGTLRIQNKRFICLAKSLGEIDDQAQVIANRDNKNRLKVKS